MKGPHLLPLELQQEIFFQLAYIGDIASLALACRALWLAFLDAGTLIENKVLRNEITLDVLPEAYAVVRSARMQLQSQRTPSSIQQFMDDHFTWRIEPPDFLESKEIYALRSLARLVNIFASKFTTHALQCSPGGRGEESTRPSTSDETARIHRALYRFELWCNLFQTKRSNETIIEPTNQYDVFFAKFAPWENEQLACIYQHLARAILPAFNDVAEHDVYWGAVRVEYGDDDIATGFIQFVLSLGLKKILDLLTARSFEARRKVLNTAGKYYPSFNLECLYDALSHASGEGGVATVNFTPLYRFTAEDEEKYIRKPFFYEEDDDDDDDDGEAAAVTGPEHCWRWAHAREFPADFVNSASRAALREWGYVLWDRARLDSWGVLDTAWTPPDEREEREQEQRRASRRAECEFSFRRRFDIQQRGGTGWWSVSDESRVEYPSRPREVKSKPAVRKPLSLADAKDILSSIRLPSRPANGR